MYLCQREHCNIYLQRHLFYVMEQNHFDLNLMEDAQSKKNKIKNVNYINWYWTETKQAGHMH